MCKNNQIELTTTTYTIWTKTDRKIFDDPTSFFNQGNTLEKDEEERRFPCTQSLECNFLD